MPLHGYEHEIEALKAQRDELLAALNDMKCRLRAWMMADDDAGSADAVELLTDLSADVEDAIAKAEGESGCLRRYVTCDADEGGPETWCENCRAKAEGT